MKEKDEFLNFDPYIKNDDDMKTLDKAENSQKERSPHRSSKKKK